ncbi:MAG: hypothetical protein ABSG86_16710 [Thermoguttaceae bacterium]|jgi:hypothetical protein
MNRQRFVLACVVACSLADAARSEEKTYVKERLYAWKLGIKLSTAAWAHYQGASKEDVDSYLDACRTMANKGLGTDIPAFPAKKDTAAENGALAMKYITTIGGKPIGQNLAKQFGNEVACLFELAMKARLTLVVYQAKKGDELNAELESALARSGKGSALPEALWQPLVTKIKDVATEEEVKREVLRLDEEVTRHLLAEMKK